MVFEDNRPEKVNANSIEGFFEKHFQKGQHPIHQRNSLIADFCKEQGISLQLGRGIIALISKFNRVKTRKDITDTLGFAKWLTDPSTALQHMKRKGRLVYLADSPVSIQDVFKNMQANHTFWSRVFGEKIFSASEDDEYLEPRILKANLPLDGYYLGISGGSGSGTFSADIALGYDEKHLPSALRGQIWRVGVDIEVLPSGESVFRVIRTGSGQKSQGDEKRQEYLDGIKSGFLDKYKVSPQRILLFLALQMAHDLGFEKVKGLSTQGAMDLSLLGNSKTPIDYTSSMLDVGFTYQEGNWHKIDNLQKRFYSDIFAANWHGQPTDRYDVKGFSDLIQAFNAVKDEHGEGIDFKLAERPDDLADAWMAHAKIHQENRDRRLQNGK